MQKFLQFLEKTVSLSSIDNPKGNILDSAAYQKFVQVLPRLCRIQDVGLEKNPEELKYTMQHTLRALTVYSQFRNGVYEKFKGFNLSQESIKSIQRLLGECNDHQSSYLSLVLALHDIGRPFDRVNHSYESIRLVETFNLLEKFNLTEKERLLVSKVIKYHLLVGSIYSGESTFYYLTSLCQDHGFVLLLEDIRFIKLFAALITVFTVFDIWGYSYGRIFDHYLRQYTQIKDQLVNLLSLWPNREILARQARIICQTRIEWRLASAVRIFQYLETSQELTYNFYVQKVKEAVAAYLQQELDDVSWVRFKRDQLSEIYKTQLKYGLGLLQRLASGQNYRHVRKGYVPQRISPDLIRFWVLLDRKIRELNQTSPFPHAIWNIFFDGLPRRYLDAMRLLLELDMTDFEKVIAHATPVFDSIRQENILNLDFSTTF